MYLSVFHLHENSVKVVKKLVFLLLVHKQLMNSSYSILPNPGFIRAYKKEKNQNYI